MTTAGPPQCPGPHAGEQCAAPGEGDPASTVMMYSTAVCPYCVRAERYLAARGVHEIAKVRVDLEPARRVEMMQRTGRRTVPQIYIGDRHVGGFEDLVALDRAGGLEALLHPA